MNERVQEGRISEKGENKSDGVHKGSVKKKNESCAVHLLIVLVVLFKQRA